MRKIFIFGFGLLLSLSLFSNQASANELVTIPEESIDSHIVQPTSFNFLWYQTINHGYQSKHYGTWKNGVSGKGKGGLTLSKTVSVNNTFTGTLSASKSAIDAAVGFSISKSNSTTASYTVQVPAGKTYMIQWRPVYKKYKVQQKAYSGSTFLETTYVYPLKYDHIQYRWIEVK